MFRKEVLEWQKAGFPEKNRKGVWREMGAEWTAFPGLVGKQKARGKWVGRQHGKEPGRGKRNWSLESTKRCGNQVAGRNFNYNRTTRMEGKKGR
jgi:hypothetical protein